MRARQAPELAAEVQPESLFLWQAYHHLRGSRQIGFGAGPIPVGAITDYCDRLGIACPVRWAFVIRAITAMDNLEREHYGKDRPRS